MKKKILVVEDDIDISENLKVLFEVEGYSVTLARNGKIALEHLKASSELPNLILLDLMMPIMDGFEFRSLQLQDSKLAAIPVVIMTAGGNFEAKMLTLGAHGFIKKPLDIGTVLQLAAKCSTS